METTRKNMALSTLANYLGDNLLVLSHRLSEMSSKGPFLEEDIAQSNIALDLLGQAEALLNLHGKYNEEFPNADALSYGRSEYQYKNNLLVELPNKDFAHIITRQCFHDIFLFHCYTALSESDDLDWAGMAQSGLKEVRYHLRHSSHWMQRLGKGTAESKAKLKHAIDYLYPYTAALFESDAALDYLAAEGIFPSMESLKENWAKDLSIIMKDIAMDLPTENFFISGGRKGTHTEHLGHLLVEMQYLHLKYPEANW